MQYYIVYCNYVACKLIFFTIELRTGLILPRDVPKLANLQGAVQRVIVNGEVFDKLMEVDASLEQQNVGVYRGPPCGHMPATHLSSSHGRTSYLLASSAAVGREGSPCQNNGICQPLLASFVCKCLPGFTGKRCEKRKSAVILSNVKQKKSTFFLILSVQALMKLI